MARPSIRAAAVAASLLVVGASSLLAGPARLNSIERFGIGGYIQPVGLHHGFHIERVAPDSAASKDHLQPHDIIVKVDGEDDAAAWSFPAGGPRSEAYGTTTSRRAITYIRGARSRATA